MDPTIYHISNPLPRTGTNNVSRNAAGYSTDRPTKRIIAGKGSASRLS